MDSSAARKIRLAVALLLLFAVIAVSAFFAIRLHNRNRPLAVIGAVIQQNEDARKQSPIADVVVTPAFPGEPASTTGQIPEATKTNAYGYFKLVLPRNARRGQPVTLQFRHPKYRPYDLSTVVGDTLYVIHLQGTQSVNDDVPGNLPTVAVTNIVVRYSIETSTDENIGTGVTTFQVPNTGGAPCDPHNPPCSPDGRWKASVGSASLDAGQGNIYRNARVFCIAGPCPFTKIVSDNFTQGGRNISVSLLNWSDTTTFLFQAEVFRQQVSDIVRESYPVIYGRTFNFSLPSSAEGPSLEAELDRALITFPLGPDPRLSWASCNVVMGSRYSKSYRCELKLGYKFP